MTQGNLYLRQNVLVEPLFNQWYAWSYLIAPTTAAMYVENLHLNILRSFIATPQVHIYAQKDPALLGGPFINYPVERMGEIKDLLEKTLQENEPLLQFASALKAFDEKLQAEAVGYSLETLYQEMPEPLQGYVELVYDPHNHPSMRFFEGLLYRSPYYQPSAQSIALSLIDNDNRSFILSTPRLHESNYLNLRIPFSHQGIDELFEMKTFPKPLNYIKEQFNLLDNDEDELFHSFFTEEPPQPSQTYQDKDVRIRYYGHACLLIETSNTSILIDPLISYKYDDRGIPRYTFEDLPEKIDYVLITHNHQDHVLFEVLLQLRYKIGTIVVPRSGSGVLVDPSLKLLLKHTGFKNVIEMDEMEEIEVADGIIIGLPFLGEHGDLNIRTKLTHLVRLKGRSILCVADSNNLQPKLCDHLRKLVGKLDVLFIGMECDGAPLSWLYGPLLTKAIPREMDQSRRINGSNFERALDMVEGFAPEQVYVYAMGQEPWMNHLLEMSNREASKLIIAESNKLVEECNRRGLTSERLFGQKEIILSV
ncbi:MBL fold metallo-hydrolase [Scytonema sp. UIC 10036]|uniref:MBL fold metallo-hydrolase n=1 Tax=Scytonema sp. UIC 10036 TaxID=2304196 RepID=UPI0012DA0E10|nr:MBL fold metallo-hydrolase [Scytonema sp. UIC 10036]MUH00709.1 MBL fold metallo-hydrolase [Scytonema sp. UIC 10036]